MRYRAHVAFSTVKDLLNNLESVHNRRKALVYVSDGYDFNPFQDARLGLMDPNSPFAAERTRASAESHAAERRRQQRVRLEISTGSRSRARSSPTPISRASSAS